MNKPLFEDLGKIYVSHGEPKYFVIAKANRAPPLFFKDKRTDQIFAALDREIVRTAINLNKDFVIQEGKVHYSPMTKEWVLGSVSLTEEAYQLLGANFSGGRFRIEACPVTEKHDLSWGPVSP